MESYGEYFQQVWPRFLKCVDGEMEFEWPPNDISQPTENGLSEEIETRVISINSDQLIQEHGMENYKIC